MVSVFYRFVREIISKCVPKKKRVSHKYPVWFTPQLIRLLREKLKYRRKLKKNHNNPLDEISFNILRDRCRSLRDSCYTNYMTRLERSLKSNPKLIWSFVKSKKQTRSTYPASMNLENKTATSGPDICNLFASHFSSVYNTSSVHNSPNYESCNLGGNSLCSIYLNK